MAVRRASSESMISGGEFLILDEVLARSLALGPREDLSALCLSKGLCALTDELKEEGREALK